MNKIFQLIFTLLLFAVAGCKKVENKIYFEGGTNPEITSNASFVELKRDKENENAITFRWNNPGYRFSTGVSSHDVDYTIEMDTLGGNFSSGAKAQKVVTKDLSYTFTVKELNGILETAMNLQTDRLYDIEVRVVASIKNSVPLISKNKVVFKTRPYPSKEYWLVGAASEGGWNNPLGDPFIKTQKFSPISPTKFELVTKLNPNEGYLVLPVMGSWDTKYCLEDGVDRASTVNGGSFVFKTSGGQDFLSPTPGGVYKLTFDFQSLKFTVVKQ